MEGIEMIYEEKEDKDGVVPIWMNNFKLFVPGYKSNQICNPVWSPDGAQLAYTALNKNGTRIVIFDWNYGPLRFHPRCGNDDDDNDFNTADDAKDEHGWIAYDHDGNGCGAQLKFAPNRKFLVSSSKKIVKLWEYGKDDDGYYYRQLQEWDVQGEIGQNVTHVDVSPCSGFVPIVCETHVLLKSVSDHGNTIQLASLPEGETGEEILFSNHVDGQCSVYVLSRHKLNNREWIRSWNPLPDDDGDTINDDSFVTIAERSLAMFPSSFAVSRNNAMLSCCDGAYFDCQTKLYSVDAAGSSQTTATLVQTFPGSWGTIHFTADDNYIAYRNNRERNISLWDIEAETSIPIVSNPMFQLHIVDFSPRCGKGQYMLLYDMRWENAIPLPTSVRAASMPGRRERRWFVTESEGAKITATNELSCKSQIKAASLF